MLPILFTIGPLHIGSLTIGPLPIHSWGLLLMLGFLAGTYRASRNAKRYGFAMENVWDVALIALAGGVLGARLAFVLLNIKEYVENPAGILALWTGGMTFYGGLFGGLLAGALACQYKKMNLGDFADLAAVSLPIGYALGRIGCFLNGCCYGGACDLPWATRFHLPNGTLTEPSHPAQIYAAIISAGIYFLLLPIEKNRRFRGQVMLWYVLLYAVYRFFIEFVREGATADLSGIGLLTQGQVASLIFAALATVVLVVLGRRSVPRPALS